MKTLFKNLKCGLNKHSSIELCFISFLITVIIICAFGINKCYGNFYDALATKSYKTGVEYITYYVLLSLLSGFCESEIFVRKRLFSVYFREKIYNYYNVETLGSIDSRYVCQRMSQDLIQFPEQFINLFQIFLHSCLLIPVFLYILFSNNMSFFVIFGYIFVAFIGTVVSKFISKPIIKLQYQQESLEAKLRRELINEISKNNDKQLPDITEVNQNYKKIAYKERLLIYFKNTYISAYHFVPYVILIPKYFTNIITLGVMIKSGSAMTRLAKEIGFFIENLDKIIEFSATNIRISELKSRNEK